MKITLIILGFLASASHSYAQGSDACYAKLVRTVEVSSNVAGAKARNLTAVLEDARLLQQGFQGTAVQEATIINEAFEKQLTTMLVEMDNTCLK